MLSLELKTPMLKHLVINKFVFPGQPFVPSEDLQKYEAFFLIDEDGEPIFIVEEIPS